MRSLFNIGNKIKPFNRDFIIEVNTALAGVSASNQFQFTGAVGEYDIKAYQNGSLVESFNDLVNEETITLPSSGIYELRCIIKPAGFDKMRFNNTGDRLKLLKILNWGLYGVNEPDQSNAFRGCANNTEIATNGAWFDVVTSGLGMFFNNALTSLPVGMNLPLLTSGLGMFFNNSLTSLPPVMDLPLLTGGFNMFSNNNLTSLPSVMNLPLLTNGGSMFSNNNLTSLPVGMNLPLLTGGFEMFANNNLTSLPVGMNLPLLTGGVSMFRNNDITSLPVGMELPLLTNGGNMFSNNNLTSLPVGMEFPNLTNGNQMFRDNSLTSLPSGMNLPLLTNGGSMFSNNDITSLPVGMELPNLSNGFAMFLGSTINTERYSQILIDLEANNTNDDVAFHGGNSKYNAQGEIARNALVARGWTITDGGLEN